jgi:hypothetical protein
MAADSTTICNLALNRMGQPTIDSISGTDVLSEKCNLIYTQMLEELLVEGPELGWKFARRRYNCVLDDAVTITAFTDLVTDTTTTVTAAHTLVAGDNVEIAGTTNYDGVYTVVSIVAGVSFVITKAYVADDATGTARWTSEDYEYRYAMPTSLRIINMRVGGLDVSDWRREGVYLLTNQEDTSVDLTYVQSVTDTTLFPPQFTRVLVLKIAIQLHYNLTQDLNAIQALHFDLEKAMSKAIAMDEREKYVQEESFSWVDAGHNTDMLEDNRYPSLRSPDYYNTY